MNDRLQIAAMSNHELRTAIRETEKTCGSTVNEAHKEAAVHLAALRKVERSRATAAADALLAKAGESADCCKAAIADLESRADNVEAEMRDMIRDRDAQIARLKAELERVTAPLKNDEVHQIAKHYGMFPNVHNCCIVEAWDRAIAAVKMSRPANKEAPNG